MRESSKRRTTCSQKPHFIAIPHGADRVDNGAAFFIFFAEERQKHSHAEIEAFEEVEANPQYGNQDKPKDLEKFVRHGMPLLLVLSTDGQDLADPAFGFNVRS